jgi:D-lyxose ketol-isomerase
MKRSEINEILKTNVKFISDMKFHLPPFAFWGKQEWKDKDERYNEIRDAMLGWDITDFGYGDFKRIGLLMFTIRNGGLNDPRYPKPYAEKLLISEENQVTPYHYHYQKMEDIINRGGGNLLVQVYNSTPEGMLDKESMVMVYKDGFCDKVSAGTIIRLTPGESITLQPRLYHSFWGEEGTGKVLIGEVSKVNDDRVDNHFLESTGRFPSIEEDAEPLYLLYQDYAAIP